MTDAKIALAGPGYTGSRLLRQLPELHTRVISRPPYDFDRPLEELPLIDSAERIIYTIPPSAQHEHDARLERFLKLLLSVPERFVYISTTGVYGNCDGKIVDETANANPQSARSKRRWSAEQQLQDWSAANDVSLVILRVPAIYGPGRLGLERIQQREAVIAETEAAPGNRIHVDDLARCCVAALDVEKPSGIYNVGDGDHRSHTAFAHAVATAAHLPQRPEISMHEAQQTFTASQKSFLGEAKIIDTAKMRDQLGVIPLYPSAEAGIAASLGEAPAD